MKLSENKITICHKIGTILLGVFFFAITLELGLRLGGFLFTSYQEHRNRISLRQKGAYRIMCLGASTTAGQWPPFLEQILNQHSMGIKFSVVDKGFNGVNTSTILRNLEKNLTIYKPDMVIAMVGNNDDFITYYKDIPEANTGIFRHCRSYRFVRLITTHMVKKLKKADIYGLDKAGSKRTVKWKRAVNVAEKEDPSGEESLKKAIELDPGNDRAYTALALCYQSRSEYTEAGGLFKKIIELNPGNYRAYLGLGQNFLFQNKPFVAEGFTRKAIELDPKDIRAYIQLALICLGKGKFSEAEGLFKKLIELDPGNDKAYIELAQLYRYQGKFIEAEGVLNKAIELSPQEDSMTYRLLEILYEEMGKTGLAKKYGKKAKELGFNNYLPVTISNYHRIKAILDKREIRLVCVQYPMRSVEPLKKIFTGQDGVLFVDNEKTFKDVVRSSGYKEYFRDMFAGDFGHCTNKGNILLAENIAKVILKEIYK